MRRLASESGQRDRFPYDWHADRESSGCPTTVAHLETSNFTPATSWQVHVIPHFTDIAGSCMRVRGEDTYTLW
jgi:hypothetical protein